MQILTSVGPAPAQVGARGRQGLAPMHAGDRGKQAVPPLLRSTPAAAVPERHAVTYWSRVMYMREEEGQIGPYVKIPNSYMLRVGPKWREMYSSSISPICGIVVVYLQP